MKANQLEMHSPVDWNLYLCYFVSGMTPQQIAQLRRQQMMMQQQQQQQQQQPQGMFGGMQRQMSNPGQPQPPSYYSSY